MDNTKPIFAPQPVYGYRLFSIIVISIVLIAVDNHYDYLKSIRSNLATMVYPLQVLVHLPSRFASSITDLFRDKNNILSENLELKQEKLLLLAELQKLLSLESENERLRLLLKSSSKIKSNFLIAEILQIDPDPFSHVVVLNKGLSHAVYLGQPIIDAKGVMGKIIEVNELTSRAMLITDTSHGLPIENVRNGVRAIAIGTGNMDKLELQHVPLTSDLKLNDKLVTSGLGGGYPSGYPVGQISKIMHEPGAPFATIWVEPTARLEQSREVLMVKAVTSEINKGEL